MTLVQELQKFTVPRQLPLVLTGDLNSQQDRSLCCSVLQCVAVCCSMLQLPLVLTGDLNSQQDRSLGCSVLKCVAEFCSVLQCVAVCSSV